MTAALLCPGPSLSRTFDDDFAGIRIGVNRAAVGFQCEIWAALDYPLIKHWREHVKGTPRLFTRRQTWLDIQNRAWFPSATVSDDLACPVKGWTLYTATCALVLASTLGVSEVKVYGADWEPEAHDFDGVAEFENRSADRFARERELWTQIVAWMGERGIGVERITG